MVTDTGRFVYNSVNSNTLSSASRIIELFNPQSIYNELYKKSHNFIKFSAYVQSNYKLMGETAYIVLPKGIEKKFNLKYENVSSSVFLLMQASEVKYGVFAS